MDLKPLIFMALVIGSILVVALNPHLVADKVLVWAQQNPTDPHVVDILYDTGRGCQMLTDDDTAIRVYNDIYQQFPDNPICAEVLYRCGRIEADSSYLKGIRVRALPFLQIVVDQYSKQDDWATKAQQLIDEVNK